MEAWLGNSLGSFLGITLVLMGGASIMAGQALAEAWRPIWHMPLYALLLGAGDRFLIYALAGGKLLSPAGYMVDTALLMVLGLASFRVMQVHRMVTQYPWLYERAGLFGWRSKEA